MLKLMILTMIHSVNVKRNPTLTMKKKCFQTKKRNSWKLMLDSSKNRMTNFEKRCWKQTGKMKTTLIGKH